MNHYTESKLLKIVEEILDLDPAMGFVAIIDLKGNILEAIMKEKKTSLETQKQQEKFCKDSAKTRLMREYYDESLGKTRYAHIERENVTQIYLYPQKSTIFVTMEPELSIDKKMSIITKIKKISTNL